MRLAFLAAGLGVLISAPLHAQPFIIPLSPQPQRQPPRPPPPSPVPIAPAQGATGGSVAGQPLPPAVVYNGGSDQRLGSPPGFANGASAPARPPP